MRKRYRVLILAAVAAALIVPVGFALSLESAPVTPQARYAAALPAAESVIPTAAATALAAPISTHLVSPAGSLFEAVPDAAKLFCVGTVLFALAAAVRKAI
jgi:hypothetical protein